MKHLALLTLCFLQVFALTPKEAYEKASMHEENGNIKKAMEWYKKAANLALEQNDSIIVTDKSPTYLKEEAKSYKELSKGYKEYIKDFKDKETDESVEQMITGVFGIDPYHINYLMPFVYDKTSHDGRKDYEAQFQISFKKDIYSNLFGFNEMYAFGYTQTSWWQIYEDSSPFRETNYRPEFFVYGFYGDKDAALKGYQFGFLHESNGEDGEKSRSWNRIYLTTFWQAGDFFITPRVWYRIPEREKRDIDDVDGDDNPDIESYLGYGDLTIAYPWRKHLFRGTLRNNLKFNGKNRGSFEFEWTFPLWSDSFFGYINYFTGYGASLLDYNKHNDKIGIGFALSR